MNFGLNRPSPFLFFLAVTVSSVAAHPDHSVTLENFSERLRKNPADDQARAERAWLQLNHGESDGGIGEDIDSLISRPQWRAQGLRLRAFHLFLMSRLDDARTLILENMQNEKTNGPEQARLLARIGLAKGDTAAAIEAYAKGWDKRREEIDFLDMMLLYRARRVPADVLKRGLDRHPQSPGVCGAVFEAYMAQGNKAGVKKALEVSNKAMGLWPRGVDWKVRHAKALLKNAQGKKAEETLLVALQLLDESPNLEPNAATTASMRKEIFGIMESLK